MPRRYSEAQKTEIVNRIDEQRTKGISTNHAAAGEGISNTSYWNWKRTLSSRVVSNGEQAYVEQIQLELNKVRAENTKLRKKLGELLIERELG